MGLWGRNCAVGLRDRDCGVGLGAADCSVGLRDGTVSLGRAATHSNPIAVPRQVVNQQLVVPSVSQDSKARPEPSNDSQYPWIYQQALQEFPRNYDAFTYSQ